MTAAPTTRIGSLDILRGAVMVLMAIDHVRVYAGVPPGGPTPGVFFTRWVTHFCAPVFVFLAGTSAWLHARREPRIGRFLATRGLWLVLLELTVLRLAWTFNLDFGSYLLAGVIWMLGWCMVLLALLVRLPAAVVGGLGLAIIAGHNLLDGTLAALSQSLGTGVGAALWKLGYVGFWAGPIRLGETGPQLFVLYSLVPWIGVMMAGYGFGAIVSMEPARRDRACLELGLGAIALFGVLRGFRLYGDPSPWGANAGMPALLGFLNTSKYPASLQFLLMTIGPAVALVPLLERARGVVAAWMTVFGRVPFFYYLLHIPLIHLLAIGVSWLRTGAVDPWLFANHPMGNPQPPDGYAWSLGQLYLTWLVAVALLYVPCRWFAEVRARRGHWWLSYL